MWPSSAVPEELRQTGTVPLVQRWHHASKLWKLLAHPVVDLPQVATTGSSLGEIQERAGGASAEKNGNHFLIGARASSLPLSAVRAHNVFAFLVAPSQFAQEVARKVLSREAQVCQLGQWMKLSYEGVWMTMRKLALGNGSPRL